MLVAGVEARELESEVRIASKGDVVVVEGEGFGEMGMWLIEAVGGTLRRFARSKVWQKAVGWCDDVSWEAEGGARSGSAVGEKESQNLVWICGWYCRRLYSVDMMVYSELEESDSKGATNAPLPTPLSASCWPRRSYRHAIFILSLSAAASFLFC